LGRHFFDYRAENDCRLAALQLHNKLYISLLFNKLDNTLANLAQFSLFNHYRYQFSANKIARPENSPTIEVE
jgi:hypothetical protein